MLTSSLRIGALAAVVFSILALAQVALAASPTITLSLTSGAPGTSVTVTGAGFPPGELVSLYMDKPGPYLGTPGPNADAHGNFVTRVEVPPVSAGPHTICGQAPSQSTATCVDFTVLSAPITATHAPSPTPQPAASDNLVISRSTLITVVVALVVVGGGAYWLGRRST